MKDPLRDIASEALEWVRRQGGHEAEVYLARSEERGIEMRSGALEGLQQSAAEGVGLRVLRDGRMGFASAGGLDLETIKGLFAKVAPQLEHLERDATRVFASPSRPSPGDEKAFAGSLWDESLFTEPLGDILPRLKTMEAGSLKHDKRITSIVRLGYGESRGEVVVANTRGVLSWERGGSASVGMSALSREGDELQTGSAFQSSRRKADLDFDKVGREGAWRATALLGSRKLPGATRGVLFDPWVAGEFLDLVSGLLSAEDVQRGRSLLAGKLGKKIGSALVTFIDDPRMPGGLASSLYDDEGCTTRAKTMIEAGVVKDYFYDAATARKEDRETNASAGRGSYRGIPGPTSSNFYLAAGKSTREQIIGDTKDGLLVLDVMGMHTADPISGEFSVGVSGISVRGGELTHAVKGAMISGNVLDLLEKVDAVGSDLTFYGSAGAPTFRVADMTVA